MKLWGGRFEKRTDKLVEEFTSSLPFDRRLYDEDIRVSDVHAMMLARIGLLTEEEAKSIGKALKDIKKDMEKGIFKFEDSDEDIHTAIERALIEKLGPVGGKLRTARSRNDQAVTDLRLYLKKETAETIKLIEGLQEVLIKRAENDGETVMPGYTHLQKAQPILLGHHLMAYFFMLKRDKERFEDCLESIDRLPLGSGALAGTTFEIDRAYAAKKLGFSGVIENSLDAVSDRDFAIDFMACASICLMHLSRFSEELVLWCSSEFGFVEMDESYATGSSIMPQKKNPDVAELVRAKTGRVYGNLTALLTVMKGLPLAYNRDMQEDKEVLFDTVDTLTSCLKVFSGMLRTLRFNHGKMYDSTYDGFMTATDVADYLADKGMPFKDAHEVVGNIVKHCLGKGMRLTDMSLAEFSDFSALFGRDIIDVIRPRRSVERRATVGSTSPGQVKEQIKTARKLLGRPAGK
jgi:argininosuccinate lyase